MKAFEIMCEGFRYVGNCTQQQVAPHLEDMMSGARQISFRTFVAAVGLENIKGIFRDYQWGRGKDLRMKNDPYVTYYKSTYDGKPCYYIRESGIEYVFVDEKHLDDDHEDVGPARMSTQRFSIKADGAVLQGVHTGAIFDYTRDEHKLEYSMTSSPSKQAALAFINVLKHWDKDFVIFDGEEEDKKELISWLEQSTK